MTLLDGLAYSLEGIFYYLSVFGELLLITSCLATIVYITTKNQYISYLAAGPIYFALSHIFYQSSQLFLVIIAMSIQALVILFIQKKGLAWEIGIENASAGNGINYKKSGMELSEQIMVYRFLQT